MPLPLPTGITFPFGSYTVLAHGAVKELPSPAITGWKLTFSVPKNAPFKAALPGAPWTSAKVVAAIWFPLIRFHAPWAVVSRTPKAGI